ncbi:MAG: hypothetical protein ACOYEK_08630 [bacterium]|jgi:hypothetical protein
MQVKKVLGWEIHLPAEFILKRKSFSIKVFNATGQKVAEATIKLNQAAVVDILSPLRLDIRFREQQIIINPKV